METNTTPQSSPVTTTPQKKKRGKRNRKWEIIPWSERGKDTPPIFTSLLWQLLQRPKSDFEKDPETGEWPPFMRRRNMTISELICVRLILSAANNDLGAQRELLDRIDGRTPWTPGKDGESREVKIGILYEADIATRERHQREALAQVIAILPPELQAKARGLLDKKPTQRWLKEKPAEPQIEYYDAAQKKGASEDAP